MLLSSLYTRITAILNLPIFEIRPIVCSRRLSRVTSICDGNVESVSKRKKHKACSDRVRTSHFVQQVQGNIDEDPSKSIRAISRNLQVSECTIRRIVHEDIRYKSYVMRKGQFMLAQTREQRFIRA